MYTRPRHALKDNLIFGTLFLPAFGMQISQVPLTPNTYIDNEWNNDTFSIGPIILVITCGREKLHYAIYTKGERR